MMLIFAVAILEIILKIKADFVACESVQLGHWHEHGDITTCNMLSSTTIKSTGVKISTKDEAVKGLALFFNRKIYNLPENVGESFPNLIGYLAYSCTISEISRQHFKGLNKLKELSFGHNFIRKIPSDTFKDLVSLEIIYLGENEKFVETFS
jgi:Leucine rich repeat